MKYAGVVPRLTDDEVEKGHNSIRLKNARSHLDSFRGVLHLR
jgi:hypothetical protein